MFKLMVKKKIHFYADFFVYLNLYEGSLKEVKEIAKIPATVYWENTF